MVGRHGLFLLGLLLVVSLNNFSVAAENHEDDDDHDFKNEFGDEKEGVIDHEDSEAVEVREPSGFSKPQAIHAKDLPVIRFLFCVSCGYKNAFEQYSQVIRDRYPEIVIDGTNYPPVAWKAYTAQAVNFLKLGIMVLIMSGQNPFESMGFGYPSVLQWAQTNKLSACMMTFLLSNMVENSLVSTGAFEIYIENELIWSKLDSGRVPSPQELLQIIDSQFELQGKIPSSSSSNFGLD